jgi:hypothetical protein
MIQKSVEADNGMGAVFFFPFFNPASSGAYFRQWTAIFQAKTETRLIPRLHPESIPISRGHRFFLFSCRFLS